MSELSGKILINDVEYITEKGLDHIKLMRFDPVSGMKVENIFMSVSDSKERIGNFKARVAQLVLEEIAK